MWLYYRVEKRISDQNYKWLSLGDHLTLIKSVLESMPMYQMMLTKVPKGILHKIRQKVFSFLWIGKHIKENIHMASWESLSLPKLKGGWGLRNLVLFGKALYLKILWHGLFGVGLQRDVVHAKYLINRSLLEWLRKLIKLVKGSMHWRNLMSNIYWIKHQLVQRFGNVEFILLKKNPILTGGNHIKLSNDLLKFFNRNGFSKLSHIRKDSYLHFSGNYWFSASELSLENNWAAKWSLYIQNLFLGGIVFADKNDQLVWSWNNNKGQVMVKKYYEVLSPSFHRLETKWWLKLLWHWQLPPKLRCFGWLALQGKILT